MEGVRPPADQEGWGGHSAHTRARTRCDSITPALAPLFFLQPRPPKRKWPPLALPCQSRPPSHPQVKLKRSPTRLLTRWKGCSSPHRPPARESGGADSSPAQHRRRRRPLRRRRRLRFPPCAHPRFPHPPSPPFPPPTPDSTISRPISRPRPFPPQLSAVSQHPPGTPGLFRASRRPPTISPRSGHSRRRGLTATSFRSRCRFGRRLWSWRYFGYGRERRRGRRRAAAGGGAATGGAAAGMTAALEAAGRAGG